MRIDISTQERAFLVIDGRPVKYLTPGQHRLFPFLSRCGWRRSR